MKLIGFSFKKISAHKSDDFQPDNFTKDISLGITNISKESASLLKDGNALKFDFNYSINHKLGDKKKDKEESIAAGTNVGKIAFEGSLIMSADEEESDAIMKDWGKKEISKNIYEGLCNLILMKCTPKAVLLADELIFPPLVPYPKIKMEDK